VVLLGDAEVSWGLLWWWRRRPSAADLAAGKARLEQMNSTISISTRVPMSYIRARDDLADRIARLERALKDEP
jgi:hypothetical protein